MRTNTGLSKGEVFKDVEGYEGIYKIGNRGTVLSVSFRNNKICKPQIKIMHGFDNGKGYLVVSLSKNGKKKNYYVHRLVAKAFIEKQSGKSFVNHKDFDRKNNAVENLEWCTQKENIRYSSERMRHEKTVCKVSNTGEKYIMKRGKRYRVAIKRKGIDKSFETFEDALKFKKKVIL